jgi:hypothetical protein
MRRGYNTKGGSNGHFNHADPLVSVPSLFSLSGGGYVVCHLTYSNALSFRTLKLNQDALMKETTTLEQHEMNNIRKNQSHK